jgi:Arc/MetJ family transcription regulator
MRTNIVLDETLVKEAFRYSTVTTKKDLVHIALQEFVKNRSRKDLRDLRGKVTFRKDYDYKALRGRPE